MHEVLTLSLSPPANNLITHFFNAQESYLDYTKSSKAQTVNPSTYLKASLRNNTVNFSPRALLWDYKNGFGSLGEFEYSHQNNDGSDNSLNGVQVIHTTSRINKSSYQVALDAAQPLPKLSKSNVRYWSDFNRLIYEPRSFNSLKSWDFDPVKAPYGKLCKDFSEDSKHREFKDFDTGVEEWENSNGSEFLEDRYRLSLEETDLMNGINVVNELDSAWSGFTSDLMSELRDDYNPKTDVFNYVIYNGKSSQQLSNRELINRIKGFMALREKSSLIVPLSAKDSNLWYSSAYQNLVYESIQVLNINNDQSKNVSFSQFKNELSYGSNERNLVSGITARINNNESIDFNNTFFQTKKTSNREPFKFSETTTKRPETTTVDISTRERKLFLESTHHSPISYPVPDSYPDDIIQDSDKLTVKLTIDSQPRALFNEWKTFVGRFLRDGDERSQMVEDLGSLASEFEDQWLHSDDEEYDDD